jgi:hypothetical protein
VRREDNVVLFSFLFTGAGRSTARSPVWKVRPVMRDTVALCVEGDTDLGEVAVVEDGGC